MGIEENDDKTINLLEEQPKVAEAEPIDEVLSQEPEDIKTIEPTEESEDQDRFEETAKFEEEIYSKCRAKTITKASKKIKDYKKKTS